MCVYKHAIYYHAVDYLVIPVRILAVSRTGVSPPPTLKYRWTFNVLVPHFYHNIYFDWLVPPPYIHTIVPAPLCIHTVLSRCNSCLYYIVATKPLCGTLCGTPRSPIGDRL